MRAVDCCSAHRGCQAGGTTPQRQGTQLGRCLWNTAHNSNRPLKGSFQASRRGRRSTGGTGGADAGCRYKLTSSWKLHQHKSVPTRPLRPFTFFALLCSFTKVLLHWRQDKAGDRSTLAPAQRRQICATSFVTWRNLQFSLITNNTGSNWKSAKRGRGCKSPLTGALYQWQGMKRRKHNHCGPAARELKAWETSRTPTIHKDWKQGVKPSNSRSD